MGRRLLGGRARHWREARFFDRGRTRRTKVAQPQRTTDGPAGGPERSDVAAALAEQRREIARDVHDGVAQELAFIVCQLQRLETSADDEPLVRELRAASRRALQEARLTIDDLRAPRDQPLAQLLESEVSSFEARFGVAVELHLDLRCEVDRDHRTAVLRIVGQALANAADHGAARRVSVRVRSHPSGVALSVADDGAGFAPAAVGAEPHGWGLLSMRERAEVLGGSFAIRSVPGHGTEVAVTLP